MTISAPRPDTSEHFRAEFTATGQVYLHQVLPILPNGALCVPGWRACLKWKCLWQIALALAVADRCSPAPAKHSLRVHHRTQAGRHVHAGAGWGHAAPVAGDAPAEAVLACLAKVRCLPEGAQLAGVALRGLTAMAREQPLPRSAFWEPVTLVELEGLLREAAGAMLERAELLQAQGGQVDACAALENLSFRCFCAVDMLHQAASGTDVDALPAGDALWGPVLEAWFNVGGASADAALPSLAHWWRRLKEHDHKVQHQLPVASQSGSSGDAAAHALATMWQQAAWLQGGGTGGLSSAAAAQHLEAAASAMATLTSTLVCVEAVGAHQLRRVHDVQVAAGVCCFHSEAVFVFQMCQVLKPDAGTDRQIVERWCSQVAALAGALCSSVEAVVRCDLARQAQGVPRFAQAVRGAAVQYSCHNASASAPFGLTSEVTVQVHCEAGWPLGQVVRDEAWPDVEQRDRECLAKQVLAVCAAAEACGVALGGVDVGSFVVVGVPSCAVGDFMSALKAGSCQVLLGACSGVWCETGDGRQSVTHVLREVLGMEGGGAEPQLGLFVRADEKCEGAWGEVLRCVGGGGVSCCVAAYAVQRQREHPTAPRCLARADTLVQSSSEGTLSELEGEGGVSSPFIAACSKGSGSRVRRLLAQTGAQAVDVHAQQELAFRLACQNGHATVVKELLSLTGMQAIDVHAGGQWGLGPGFRLTCAGAKGSSVRRLLEQRQGEALAVDDGAVDMESGDSLAVLGVSSLEAVLAAAQVAISEANARAAAAEQRAASAGIQVTAAKSRAVEAEQCASAAEGQRGQVESRVAAAEQRAVAAERQAAEAKKRALAAEERALAAASEVSSAIDRASEAEKRAVRAASEVSEAKSRASRAERLLAEAARELRQAKSRTDASPGSSRQATEDAKCIAKYAADACSRLGAMYTRGERVMPDRMQAASWYAKAEKAGYTRPQVIQMSRVVIGFINPTIGRPFG